MNFLFDSIGFFHADARYAYDVPRQGAVAEGNTGIIRLSPDRDFAAALEGLEGFQRIWVLFVFDRNCGRWHPKVQPPRHTDGKVGVFATRSPYRPNPIGISCVELVKIDGLDIHVRAHDLLDGTPVLDVKPYLPYADAFPDSAAGWTEVQEPEYRVEFTPLAAEQLKWLAENGVPCIADFIADRLCNAPENRQRKRIVPGRDGGNALAYRTWRAQYECNHDACVVTVKSLYSGYRVEELAESADKYGDKEIHRAFNALWQ